MKTLILTLAALTLVSTTTQAQAVWDRNHLDNVKAQLQRPMYSQALNALTKDADSMLNAEPLSVMSKLKNSPDGDNHNYTSLARYFHPDPSKPDGMPYINRDGITNPEINLYDRNNLGITAHRVATLALAYYMSGNDKYAEKASELLKVWFLDPATRMYPHFEYAQMVPGVNGNKGRCFGVIDGYSMIEMLDGVSLLEGSKAWTAKYDRKLKKWMSELLDWLLTSEQGREEASMANNHSIAYDSQAIAIAIAMYVGRKDVARDIINKIPGERIFKQIAPDGTQPLEMNRTLSYHYSQYNLTHLIDIFLMAQKLVSEVNVGRLRSI